MLNSYGVRLLMPFSDRWFYGDALYIVDPWLYLLLGGWGVAGVACGEARARRGRDVRRAVALALAAVYIVGMLGVEPVGAVPWCRDGLTRAGQPDTRFMVTPVIVNPFRREVLIDTGDALREGAALVRAGAALPAGGLRRGQGLRPARRRGGPGHAARARLPAAGRAFRSWSSIAPRHRRGCC